MNLLNISWDCDNKPEFLSDDLTVYKNGFYSYYFDKGNNMINNENEFYDLSTGEVYNFDRVYKDLDLDFKVRGMFGPHLFGRFVSSLTSSDLIQCIKMFECIIPKGSRVIYGEFSTGLKVCKGVISDRIIIRNKWTENRN